ncbi:MAG: DegT/DnrJ/EryC1/StrS family aminotransferase [Verrucomicrobiota bacterium]|nr:DegT/DnrJ/EryC1/StrS family aminotransferase [Verrucomicrobiota bacterium]
MRVSLLDLSEQYRALAEPIRAEIDEVLRTQDFILGAKVEEFEAAIAQFCGVPHAIGVSSGTDALLAILMAFGLGRGDAVITTAYTFFATAGCIARVGATPVFVDIEPNTYNISPVAVERYLRENCQRDADGVLRNERGEHVRALVPVHLFGLCCEMKALQAIAAEYGLALIEDAAQAIGAEYPSAAGPKQAGAMGIAGCFSFYPSKNLGAAGDAGLVICRDDDVADRLRVLRQHGMELRYFHHVIGGNFRLDGIQAAVLKVKLPFLNEWSAARRTVADFYREEFTARGITGHLTLPAEPFRGAGLTNHHIYHQYVIRTAQRDRLRDHLSQRGVGTAIYYPLGLHQQKCFEYLGYCEGDLPETERAARETLALPIYPELTREQQPYVVDSIADFFAAKN